MKIVIGGAGAVGTHLSKLLSKDHQDCVLVDDYIERLAGLESRYDIMTLHGSPTSIQTLKEAGVEDADLFVGVTTDESRNMTACMIAHALGAKKTVARIDNIEYLAPAQLSFFEQMGINSLIYPEALAGIDITNGLKMSLVRHRCDVHGAVMVM
jgi:trk system potassium uptake protein TrkA